MEKNIRKRVCRSAAVLSAVLVVISGYGFFFSSNGLLPQEEGGCQDGIPREAAALAEIREDDRTRDVEGHDLDGQWRYGISVFGRKHADSSIP